jgi:hypothetical protein
MAFLVGLHFFQWNTDPGLAGETGASGDVGTVYPLEGLKIGGVEIVPPIYGPPWNPPPIWPPPKPSPPRARAAFPLVDIAIIAAAAIARILLWIWVFMTLFLFLSGV